MGLENNFIEVWEKKNNRTNKQLVLASETKFKWGKEKVPFSELRDQARRKGSTVKKLHGERVRGEGLQTERKREWEGAQSVSEQASIPKRVPGKKKGEALENTQA